jgi:hypothetical protein
MTESSSSMITDAAGTDDQSDEDSGKFMHKKYLILILKKRKLVSPLSIIPSHNTKHSIIDFIDMQMP